MREEDVSSDNLSNSVGRMLNRYIFWSQKECLFWCEALTGQESFWVIKRVVGVYIVVWYWMILSKQSHKVL